MNNKLLSTSIASIILAVTLFFLAPLFPFSTHLSALPLAHAQDATFSTASSSPTLPGTGDTCTTDADCSTGLRCFDNPNPESGPQCQPSNDVTAYQMFLDRGYTTDFPSLGISCPGGYGCPCGGPTAVLCEQPLTCVSKDLDTPGLCCTDADRTAGLCPPDPADPSTAPLTQVGEGQPCGPNYRAYCGQGLECSDFVCVKSTLPDFSNPADVGSLFPDTTNPNADPTITVSQCPANSAPVNDPIQVPCVNSDDPSCTRTLYRAKCKNANDLTPTERQALEQRGYVFKDTNEDILSCIKELPANLRDSLPFDRDIPAPFSDSLAPSISEIRLNDITFWIIVKGDGTLTATGVRPSDELAAKYASTSGVQSFAQLTGGVTVSPFDLLDAAFGADTASSPGGAVGRAPIADEAPTQVRTASAITGAQTVGSTYDPTQTSDLGSKQDIGTPTTTPTATVDSTSSTYDPASYLGGKQDIGTPTTTTIDSSVYAQNNEFQQYFGNDLLQYTQGYATTTTSGREIIATTSTSDQVYTAQQDALSRYATYNGLDLKLTSQDLTNPPLQCVNYNGRLYCRVTSTSSFHDTGAEVCGSLLDQVCIGFTEPSAAVCQLFHTDAQTATTDSGDQSGVYCDGAPQTGACETQTNTCVTCPDCDTGIGCTTPIGNLYREAYVECAPRDGQRYAQTKSLDAIQEPSIGWTVYTINMNYADLRQQAITRCPNKPAVALYLLSQLSDFTLPHVQLNIPSVQDLFTQFGGNQVNSDIATQLQLIQQAQLAYNSLKAQLSSTEVAALGNEHFDTIQSAYSSFLTTTSTTVTSTMVSVADRDVRSPFELYPPPTVVVDEIGGACGEAVRAECSTDLVCAEGKCVVPRDKDETCLVGSCKDGLTCFINPNPYGRNTCQPADEVASWESWTNGEKEQCPGGFGCECTSDSACQDPLDCVQVGGTVARPDKVCCTYVDWLNGACDGLPRDAGSVCESDSDCKSGGCERTADNEYTCV